MSDPTIVTKELLDIVVKLNDPGTGLPNRFSLVSGNLPGGELKHKLEQTGRGINAFSRLAYGLGKKNNAIIRQSLQSITSLVEQRRAANKPPYNIVEELEKARDLLDSGELAGISAADKKSYKPLIAQMLNIVGPSRAEGGVFTDILIADGFIAQGNEQARPAAKR